METYCHNGWTVVQLADLFQHFATPCAQKVIKNTMGPWCLKNIGAYTKDWEENGITKHSFRFQFRKPEDALCFKLVFGGKITS